MINHKLTGENLVACLATIVLLLLFPSPSFSQYHLADSIYYHEENTTTYTFPGDISVIANVPVRQHAFIVDVDIADSGYYRIFPKIRYNVAQTNESFYLTILMPTDPQSGTRPISYPTDTNAGIYRVVENFPGDTLIFQNAGLFFFDQGINSVVMHHYAAIADSFPQFINDPFTGGPESVHMVDSIKIVAEPNFVDLDNVIKSDLFEDRDNDGAISLGDIVSYTITTKNSGTGIAHDVVFTDSIPQNTSYVTGSATTSKGTIQNTSPVLTINIGTVAALESEIITISFQAEVTTETFLVENQGFIDSYETDPHATDDPDTAEEDDETKTLHPYFKSDTDVLKTDNYFDTNGDAKMSPGDSITYTITMRNSGSGLATNVVFTDTIPNNTTYVTGSATTTKGNIVSTAPVLVVNTDSLAAYSSETVTISFKVVISSDVTEIINQGHIDSDQTVAHPTDDPDTAEENDETITRLPSFSGVTDVLKKQSFQDIDDSGTLTNGDLISYTVSIKNSGGGMATNVVFTDSIPENTTYVAGSATTSKGSVETTSPILQVNIGNIAPNESESIIIVFQVRVTASVDQVINQGFVDSDETQPEPSDDPDTPEEDDETITRAPSFKGETDVLKSDVFVDTDRNSQISAGDTIAYTITINNSGSGTANNVVLTDTIPQNTTYIQGSAFSSKGTITSESPVFQVAIGVVKPNSSELITVTYKVLVTTSVDQIENQGFVNSDETGPHPTDDPDTPAEDDETKTQVPNFTGNNDVLKTDSFRDVDGSGTITSGDSIFYTITIKNSGSGVASNVAFTDTIPDHTILVSNSVTTSKGTIVSTIPVLQIEIGSIAQNEQETVIIRYAVVAIEAADRIENQGYVTSEKTIPEPTNDPDTPVDDDETITTPPNIEVFKRDAYQDINDDGQISSGDLIWYTLTVINSGSGYGNNVVLTDSIPQNTAYVTGTVSSTHGTIESTSPVLKVNIGVMAPNDTATIRFQVRATATTSQIENQAFLNSDETPVEPSDDPDTPEQDDETITRAPSFQLNSDLTKRDLFVDADSSGNLSPGDTISYTISIKNSGTGTATNVTFTDSIPGNTSLVSGSVLTSKGVIMSTTPVLQVDIGSVAGNESETVTITFEVVLTASVDRIENQGWIDSDETQPHPTDDPDTADEDDPTITSPPNFNGTNDVLKTDSFRDADGSGTITAGDTITYTITITNSGAGTARNVIFTDTMPEHTSFVTGSATTTKGIIEFNDPVLQVNIGTIAAQGSEIVIVRFSVIATEAANQISNQGLISGDDTIPEPTNDPDTPVDDDETITTSPSFNGSTDVLKDAVIQDVDSSYSISAGDIITYTITVQNSGKGFASDVVFTDTIPDFTSYVNGSVTTTKGNIVTTDPVLTINIGTIAANKSETVTITFRVSVTESVDRIVNQGFIKSHETPTEPTDDPDTPEEDDETIIDNSDFYTDISVYQYAVTDSFSVTDLDTTRYADEAETYTIYIRVTNVSSVKAINVRVRDIIPDSITTSNILPAVESADKDSIVWIIPTLEPGAEALLQFDATVPGLMPFGLTDLLNNVTVSATNEDPAKLANNSSIDTVYNAVPETPALLPLIEAIPSTIDVTDSTRIRVQVPEHTKSWDLVVLFPNEQTDSTFADDYISASSLTPDVWYEVDQMYKPEKMITTEKQENLIFEIIATDRRDRKASAQTTVTVVSSNYLVLDRNVFRPESETALGIKFKLSYQRNAKLDLYDVSGRHITKITEDIYDGGWNLYNWSGRTDQGLKVGSGVYIVTLRSAEFSAWKKFILVR